MSLFGVLNRRVRGFRVIELFATVVLTATVLVVYLAKTGAGDKRDDIDRVEQQIEAEQEQIRLLRAEVAAEERPERLQALASQYLGLQPISVKHEIDPEALADVAQLGKAPASAAGKAAAPAPAKPPLQPAAYVVGASAQAAPAQTVDR